MKISLFYKSWSRDFPWLEWSKASIRKFAPDFFHEIVLCLPEGETFDWPEAKIVHIRESFQGYHFQQATKCYADHFCEGDYVVFCDSDTILTRHIKEEDFFKDGKPIWLYTYFANARPDQSAWIAPMEKFVGKTPTMEVMRRHCFIWPRAFFQSLRQFCRFTKNMELVDYIKAQQLPGHPTALTFSEFNCGGWFAHEYEHDMFSWVSDSEALPAYVHQGHTWDGEKRMHEDLAKFREILDGQPEVKSTAPTLEISPEGTPTETIDIPWAIRFIADRVKDTPHKARIVRELKKAWKGKGEPAKTRSMATPAQRNGYSVAPTVTISGGGGGGRLLCVHSYPGANEAFVRHWPSYQQFGADRIVGIGTTDGKCTWPDGLDAVMDIGKNSYLEPGDALCRRLLDTVKWCLTQPEDKFAIIEYDTIPLRKMPEWFGVSACLTGGKVNGSIANQFFHNPWLFDRASGAALVAALEQVLPESASYPNNSPDLFFGLACERAGIKVGCNFKLFTRNRLDHPKDLDLACKAARDGYHVIHGCKTKEQYEAIMNAASALVSK